MTDERRLGRGLSALFGEEAIPGPPDGSAGVRQLPVELIHPSRYQPRRNFDAENLAALTESIRAQGILQPLLVRPHPELPDQ